jgi:hypothetical protein
MSLNIVFVVIGVLSLWLLIITILFLRMSSHYNNLTNGTTNKSLKAVLEGILKELQVDKNNIAHLQSRCDNIEKDSAFHIQKIGLVRFNPFKDTGGDQSFVLALLDSKNTGIVISSLYSRTGTRWYTKRVEKGKGVSYELSEEENKALKEAAQANI